MLLIDGHNLMYAIASLAQLLRAGDSQQARERFEQHLSGIKDGHIFYDGGPHGRAATQRRSGLIITYSGSGSADNAMVSYAHANQHRRLSATTGDRSLQLRLRSAGCVLLPPDRFLRSHYRHKTASNFKQERIDSFEQKMKNHQPSASETQHWLEQFRRHAAHKKPR